MGSVIYSLATIAKSSQPSRLLFGDKGNIGKCLLAFLVAIYALGVVGLAVFQRRLLYFPDRRLTHPAEAENDSGPARVSDRLGALLLNQLNYVQTAPYEVSSR
jgi:hypothetical protein